MIHYRRREHTERIVFHAATTPVPDTENHLTVLGRERGLLTIGYHYVIDRAGKPLCCRPDDTIGSHTAGFNSYSIGVFLDLGQEHGAGLTPDQMDALRFLVPYLNERYGPGLKLVGHTELGRHRLRLAKCPPFDMEELRRSL